MIGSNPTAGATLALALTSLDGSYSALVDDSFRAAIDAAGRGGPGTQAYFDSQNQTADFWASLGKGEVTFAPGTDPQGRPVAMAGTGNVDLRVQAVYAPEAVSARIGILTVTTREVTGTGISRMLTAAITVHDNPGSAPIDESIFDELVPALYESTEILLIALADRFVSLGEVESPDVDAESLASDAVVFAGEKVIRLAATLAKAGLGWATVSWTGILAESVGVGALMAIPAIIQFLGHTMRHSVVVQNLADIPLSCRIESIVHGDNAVRQAETTAVAALTTGADPLNPSRRLSTSGEHHLLFVNSTRWSSIGYVLALDPPEGPPFKVVVWVPWSGDNVIWVGSTDDTADTVWADHVDGPGVLSTSADAGGHRVTVSLNRLGGTESGAYFYCSTVVITPV